MGRYLSGLCVASLGLCAGGWLIVTTVLLRGESTDASLVSLSTGAGLAVVSAVGISCWSVAWRQRMRRDGVLGGVLDGAACPVPGGGPAPAVVPSPVPAGGLPSAGGPLSAGGPPLPGKARRSPRVLRRDMRRAARAARRQARRRGAASMGTIAYGASAARRENPAKRAGPPQRAGAAQLDSAAIEAILAPTAMPKDPTLLLGEIRALLEPLLAAAHDPAVPAVPDAAQNTMPRMMPEKPPDKRPAPPDLPAPSRTPAVAPREAPAPAPVPRPAAPVAGSCPLVSGDGGEESW
jgi:hypothetical protein